MADNTDIAFGLKVEGVEQSIKSVKDLKSAITALQNEAESSDIGSEQYKNAIEQLELLNEKLKSVSQTEKQAAKATEDMAKAEQEAAKETGDLRKQFEVLEDKLFLLAGQGKQNTNEFRALSNEAAGLNKQIEQVNQSLEGGSATKSAEGYQMLSGSLTSLKEGILELDFGKVKDGLMQAKQGFTMFGQGAKTALSGVKNALIATGIGALVVALGLIVAYWDDIKGAVTGVTEEQKKLNAASKENLEAENDKLKALNSSDNILKAQGLTEKQILDLKSKQTDEIIKAAEAQLQMTIQTQLAEKAAAERSKGILNGLINFISLPLTVLLRGIDGIGAALGQNFGLMEGFQKSITDLVLGSDAEAEAKNKKEIADQVNTLRELKNNKAGYNNAINKLDADAEKEASDRANEAAEKAKTKLEAEIATMRQIQDANIQSIKDEEKRAVAQSYLNAERRNIEINKTIEDETLKQEALKASEKTFQTEMAAIYQTKIDKQKAADEKAAADKATADAKILADRKIVVDAENAEKLAAAELAVVETQSSLQADLDLLLLKKNLAVEASAGKENEIALIEANYRVAKKDAEDADRAEKAAKEKAERDANFERAQGALNSLQSISDAFFAVKMANVTKGSAAELKAAKKQFDINKGIAIASATISGIQGVINALSAQSVVPEPFGTALKVLTAVGIAASTVANISKISSQKFDAGGGGGASAGGSASVPPIPSPPTISTPENNTNKTTSFDETGKNLNAPTTVTPTIKVTATVGVDEISAKKDRVDVLENQSTFK